MDDHFGGRSVGWPRRSKSASISATMSCRCFRRLSIVLSSLSLLFAVVSAQVTPNVSATSPPPPPSSEVDEVTPLEHNLTSLQTAIACADDNDDVGRPSAGGGNVEPNKINLKSDSHPKLAIVEELTILVTLLVLVLLMFATCYKRTNRNLQPYDPLLAQDELPRAASWRLGSFVKILVRCNSFRLLGAGHYYYPGGGGGHSMAYMP